MTSADDSRPESKLLEDEIASLIAENVGVGYQLGPDGTVDPGTIRVYAHGAAHVVIHRLCGNSQ